MVEVYSMLYNSGGVERSRVWVDGIFNNMVI